MNNKIISKVISGTILCTMLTYTVPVLAYTKDETVYSKLDTNGNEYKTIVSTHLENNDNEQILNDMSDLINIKNTNGEETFTQNGTSLEWKAEGSDIYYQGETTRKSPITCKIRYELDGKEISSEEILGKSGKIKIILEYTNNEQRIVNINGKKQNMYIPFVVVAGTIIDNSKNTDIKVSNGKIVNDGSKTIVTGLALPGMQESLNISQNDIKIPNTIEITMNSTDFEQNNIATYITPKVLEKDDLKIFDKLDDIYIKINTLQTSSKALVKGSNTLKKGTEEYSKKSKEFNTAMQQISGGVNTIDKNYSKIDKGISDLNKGSSKINTGAESLNKGIGELNTALSTLPESAEALYKGSKNLNNGINGENGLKAGIKALENSLQTALTTSIGILSSNNTVLNNEIKEVKAEVEELSSQIKTLTGLKDSLSGEEKKALENTIKQLETRKGKLETKITTLATQEKTNETVISKLQPTKESQEQLKTLNEGIEQIATGINTLETNLEKLNKSAKDLPNSLTKLSKGSKTLIKGTKDLSSGASTLNNGSSKLETGIKTLNSNTKKITKANNKLTEATSTLEQGATTLSEGIEKFDKEGIQTIYNYINGDLKEISTRVEKLQELSSQYNNFTMLQNGNNGNVKFIMIIDAIKHQEEKEKNKEEAVLESKIEN